VEDGRVLRGRVRVRVELERLCVLERVHRVVAALLQIVRGVGACGGLRERGRRDDACQCAEQRADEKGPRKDPRQQSSHVDLTSELGLWAQRLALPEETSESWSVSEWLAAASAASRRRRAWTPSWGYRDSRRISTPRG